MSRTPAAALVAGSLLGAALLSGCGVSLSGKQEPSATPRPTQSSPTTTTPTPTPSVTTTPASPTASASPSPVGMTSRLLVTAQVPRLSSGMRWSTPGSTSAAGTTPFGLCQRFDLESIGATIAVQRVWLDSASTGDTAAEQVAEFPDAMTALRASRVLTAWHNRCAEQLTNTVNPKVGQQTDVSVPVGTGRWYLVSYSPKQHPDQGHFHAFGIAVAGTRIAILRMDSLGEDYNYPPGREPMVAAVKAAAEKLR